MPVGRRPIDRHFHSPTNSVSILHATYTTFCKPSVFNVVALDDVGTNGENTAQTMRSEYWDSANEQVQKRTCIHPGNVLKRREEQHEDDSQAEYLHASTRHVEHERLHRKGLSRGYGKVPCSLFFQGCIGRYCFSCLLWRRFCPFQRMCALLRQR